MGNLIQFGSYDDEAVEQEEKELGSTEFFKPKVGRNILRFLPPSRGKKTPFLKVMQHYIDIPGRERALSFACPRFFHRPGKCPVCQRADQLHKSGNKADQRKAKDLWPNRRVFANVIDRENEDSGVLVFGFGKLIHTDLIDLRKDEGDFTHPYKGYDVVIKRKGTGKNDTKYTVRPGQEGPLHEDEKQALAWFEAQHDLTRFARVMEYDEIVAELKGETDDEDDEPRRGKRGGVIDVGDDDDDEAENFGADPDDKMPF